MPSTVADSFVAKAGGDVSVLEKLLSLEPGTLGANPVRIDIPSPGGLRMPSGNELGANRQWLPGGYTGGGIPEATVNPAKPGTYGNPPNKHLPTMSQSKVRYLDGLMHAVNLGLLMAPVKLADFTRCKA